MRISIKRLLPYWIIFYFLGTNVLPEVRVFHFVSLYLIAAFLVLVEGKKIFSLILREKWLFALLILILFSYFWSVAPRVTFANFRTSLVLYILVGHLAITYKPNEIIGYFSKVLGFVTILNLINVFSLHGFGMFSVTHWRGTFPHQSYLGAVMSMSTISSFYAYMESSSKRIPFWMKILPIIIGLTSFIAVYFSYARTPLVGLIVSFSVLPFFYRDYIKEMRFRGAFLMVLIYAFLIVIPILFISREFIIVDILGKSLDLTGRATLWEHLMQRISERPFGYGAGAFWHNQQFYEEVAAILNRRIPSNYNSHSAYIDCLLGIGYLGLFLLFSSIALAVWMSAISAFKYFQISSCWNLQIIIFLLVSSYSDTFIGFLNPRGIGWFSFCLISLSSLFQVRHLSRIKNLRRQNLSKYYLRTSVKPDFY